MREKSSRFLFRRREPGLVGAGTGRAVKGLRSGRRKPGLALGSKTCNRTKRRKELRKQGGTAGSIPSL